MFRKLDHVTDLAVFILGGSLYALAVNVFTLPANIAPGGATGIATLLHHVWGWPVGLTVLGLNLPLFLSSYLFLGRSFLTKTVVATVITSVLIDLFAWFLPAYTGNRLLAALYGGVFSGLGLALIFLRGGTTGGTDIVAKLLVLKWKTADLGQVIFLIDGLVILCSALVYRNVDSGLYACILIFTSTTLIDRMLYNAGLGKAVYIITHDSQTVTQQILQNLQRGVTLIPSQGAYSGNQQTLLFCVVRHNQVWKIKQLVQRTDPKAFMVVTDAGQVLGEGFTQY